MPGYCIGKTVTVRVCRLVSDKSVITSKSGATTQRSDPLVLVVGASVAKIVAIRFQLIMHVLIWSFLTLPLLLGIQREHQ